MKNLIIVNGADFRIMYGNELAVLETLPPSIYEVQYDEEKGFFLTNVDGDIPISEALYGDVASLTSRVMISFERTQGNLGVLLSGPKGLGKTLTIKNICKTALEKRLPVILVKENFSNLVSFIDSICQPCVIVLDEFEKLYPNHQKTERDDLDGQDSLLNMFDSALASKKLFLLTCNDVSNISEYLLNRPGRLHYHFKMNRLTIGEIQEYCDNNLNREMRHLITDICSLGAKIPDFSYDMLKAIVFELNTYVCGLEEVTGILNIDAQARSPFDYTIYFASGNTESGFDYINPSKTIERLNWYKKSDATCDTTKVNMFEARWTGKNDGSLILDGKHVHQTPDEKEKSDTIEKIVFTPARKGYQSSDNYLDYESILHA
jgi:hypothetical protein